MLNFKSMGAIAGLLQNKDRLIEAAQRVRRGLDDNPPIGESGGGAVRVTINGSLKVQSVQLSPGLTAGLGADAASADQASALIAEAVNDGLDKAKARMADALQREAKDMGIDDLPFDLTKLLS